MEHNPVDDADDALNEGRPADAVAALLPLAAAGRLGPLGRLTLGRAQLAVGDSDGALETLRDVNALNRNWAEAALFLGQALVAKQALPTAIAEFQRALRLKPDFGRAELALAEAWASAGEVERAEEHRQAAEDLGEMTDALTARLADMRMQNRSDAGYVRHLFDQFSSDYDERMRGALGYRGPEILIELLAMVSPGKPRKVATLDLGCGTGLAAPTFRPFATKLTGVDLSPQMIAQAEATGLYDQLVVSDIESWLETARPTFGRVIAADVFVYIGDLSRVFAGVRRVLKSGGLFLFTAERIDTGDYAQLATKRWAQSEAYIRRLAEEHGYDPRGLMHCTPRYNKGAPLPGLACALAAP